MKNVYLPAPNLIKKEKAKKIRSKMTLNQSREFTILIRDILLQHDTLKGDSKLFRNAKLSINLYYELYYEITHEVNPSCL